MCGILGGLDLAGGPAPDAAVARALPTLRHRGPDGEGAAASGPCAFGHVRLAILGVAQPAAAQPVLRDGYMLSFNGEIYNFHELDRALAADGIRTSGNSDTETLFACLRHWGVERTLDAVDGMFAFAWWDGAARRLTLVRDALGEKPLYWARPAGGLWFASEMKALLAAGAATPEPNLARVDDFLYTAKVNGAETLFRDIHEVEPGTLLTIAVGDDRPRIRPWWRLEDGFSAAAPGAPDSWQGAFESHLDTAMASRVLSDVPLGILLSGGIDSQTVVDRVVDTCRVDSLDLFFADNSNAAVSERADAEVFLDHLGGRYPGLSHRLHRATLGFEDYMALLERLTWHYDEPIQFYNSPLLGNLCWRAHDEGMKVLLSGEGSDEMLYGYTRFDRTRRLLDGIGDRHAKLANLYHGGGMHSVELVKALTAGRAEGPEATAPWRWLDAHLDQPLDRLQLLFSQRYRLQTLLQRQDRIGMAFGIEIRVPFLRPAFVRFVNSLPESMKFDPATGTTKVALRRAMADRLPERILTKAKDGFPSDMMVWLREPHMARVTQDLLLAADSFSQSYLDGALVRRMVDDHFADRQRQDTLIWNLLALEIWHRRFAAGHAAGVAPA